MNRRSTQSIVPGSLARAEASSRIPDHDHGVALVRSSSDANGRPRTGEPGDVVVVRRHQPPGTVLVNCYQPSSPVVGFARREQTREHLVVIAQPPVSDMRGRRSSDRPPQRGRADGIAHRNQSFGGGHWQRLNMTALMRVKMAVLALMPSATSGQRHSRSPAVLKRRMA